MAVIARLTAMLALGSRVGVLLVVTVLVAGCTSADGGASGGEAAPDGSAAGVEDTTRSVATEALQVAETVLRATRIEAGGQWDSCGGLPSFRYAGTGIVAGEIGSGEEGLSRDALVAALTDAGFTDTSAAEGHVTVEKDGITVDFTEPGNALGPGRWAVAFESGCADVPDTDRDRVEASSYSPLDGFG